MSSQVFTLIACRRTGSNYLMKILDGFPDMEFFGEVYHWDTVWMPPKRKQEYVSWLKDTKNIDLSIGEKPYEDRSLVNLNHKNPSFFLDFLGSTTDSNYAGFKIFPEHLPWPKLESNLLSNKKILKIFLKRNLLDVYISDKILKQTKKSQEYNTSNIKIEIDCLDFKHWYFTTQEYFSRVELYLRNNGQEYFELAYEDVHAYESDEEKTKFIHSWLANCGFNLKDSPQVNEYAKKQDNRKSSLGKVKNDGELKSYLQNNNLQHLINS